MDRVLVSNNRWYRAYRLVLVSTLLLLSVLVIARTVEREIVDDEGNRYVGDTVDGQIHGEGRFDWADGSSYEGDFKNGEVHGEGTMLYVDGSKYTGTFNRGERHGLRCADTRRRGRVRRYVRSGQDVWRRASGLQRLKGNHIRDCGRDGKRHGTGVLTREDGSRYSGYFLKQSKAWLWRTH